MRVGRTKLRDERERFLVSGIKKVEEADIDACSASRSFHRDLGAL
jgi:hypothetical protein